MANLFGIQNEEKQKYKDKATKLTEKRRKKYGDYDTKNRRIDKRISKLNIKGADDPKRQAKFEKQTGLEKGALLPESYLKEQKKKKN